MGGTIRGGCHHPPGATAGTGRWGQGLTLQRHSPVVLLQSGSKPLVTSQLQGPQVGWPHHPRGHGCASLPGWHRTMWHSVARPPHPAPPPCLSHAHPVPCTATMPLARPLWFLHGQRVPCTGTVPVLCPLHGHPATCIGIMSLAQPLCPPCPLHTHHAPSHTQQEGRALARARPSPPLTCARSRDQSDPGDTRMCNRALSLVCGRRWPGTGRG